MSVTYHSYVSVSEQLKNLRFILSVKDQPIVATGLGQLAEEQRRKSGTPGSIPPNSERRLPKSAELRKAAMRSLAAFSSDFEIADLSNRMIETGYKFRAINPRDSLGHLLSRLIKEGKVKLIKKGSGGQPSVYRVVGKDKS